MSLLDYRVYRQVEIEQTSVEVSEDLGLSEEPREQLRVLVTSDQ